MKLAERKAFYKKMKRRGWRVGWDRITNQIRHRSRDDGHKHPICLCGCGFLRTKYEYIKGHSPEEKKWQKGKKTLQQIKSWLRGNGIKS